MPTAFNADSFRTDIIARMYRWVLVIGCLFGASGVVTGALGAHLFQAKLSEQGYASYSTAVNYLFLHAVALVAVAVWGRVSRPGRLYAVAVVGLIVGTLLFAGGLFGWTTQGWGWARRCAPWGGSTLIFSWLGLALAACRTNLPEHDRQ